jgi:site-specific recombinase XerD
MLVRSDGEAWGKNHQQRPLTEACKRAKITPPLRFHELRHSYASALAQAGADLLTISKLLGHADTRVTSRHYAHLCDRTLANAVNNLLPDFGKEEPSNVAVIR